MSQGVVSMKSTSVSGEPQPATPAQMAAIRRLIQVIARLFYDDGHILLIDQIPSDVLARRVGLQARDLGALAAKMVEDRILSIHRTQETKEGVVSRSFSRTYYYIDYKQVLDVTKWRMLAMRREIDRRLRNGLDNKGYVCPRCKQSYSTLEVAHLLDFTRNVFICETPGCFMELVDNEDADDVRQSKDTLTRFNEQLHGVQQALRSLEGVALPPMDIYAWIAKNAAQQPWQEETERDDTKLVPGAKPLAKPQAPQVMVELSGTDPANELANEQRRAKEEEEQRAQNTLPAWHLASTVSGERTGLGRVDAERRAAEANDAESIVAPDLDDVDVDVDYYTNYAAQQNSQSSKRQADTQYSADSNKQARTESRAEENEDEGDEFDMDDVI
ncbi:hypothetical protein MYAM1_002028 [Malassezia yamatoensis]|uniref:HTH TFE/IIEalpha-type domain-containing protein n=1 Tax=Malassezia yamatoensis TaxID=253288 RepID=A0AAJ6CGX7_9BASI|nr:hypothetical protein MYAM1_002028 [Malassezia yamatoensis]